MKKTIYAIAALALVIIGCAKKEFNETYAPGDVVTVRAKVNDTYTKVAADNAGTFSWQAGDKITILSSNDSAYDFTTDTGMSDAPFTCTTFEGSLTAEAFYPASSNHTSGKFYLEPTFAWKDGETNMPMLGTVDTGTKAVSFKTAGAAIKLVCYNVPADARKLVVSSDSKKLSGLFTPSGDPLAIATAAKGDSDNTITITFGPSHPSTMIIYVPVPTGNLGKLSFVMKDGSDADISTSQTTKGNITMTRAHIVAAPALNCSSGTILWSEDFGDYESGAVPSGSVAKGYGGANVTYACTNGGGTTKIYTAALAGGVSPELLVAKTNGTFEVTGIPTNGCTVMVLKYKTNGNTIALSSPTDDISFSPSSTTTAEEHSVAITNASAAATFGITFKATGSNVRLDDIVLLGLESFDAPTITTAKESLTIVKEGGSDNTTFTINNAIIDGTPVVATVEAGVEWLTASIAENTLTVTAGANVGDARSAKVTIRATGASKEIVVSQAGASGESISYTLTPTSGTNNSYTGNCDITVDEITWNLTGNSQTSNWRLGGKNITDVNRALYSKTSMDDDICKVVVTNGAANITVNSVTLVVSTNSDFSSPIDEVDGGAFEASGKMTFNRPAGHSWKNCYFKFVYNVTNSTNSNKYVEFASGDFYTK